MNERIRELYEQAEQSAKGDMIERRKVSGPLYSDGEYTDMINQKFAELIVKECINCCDDIDVIQKHYLKYGIDHELGAGQCIEVIKKHFGVEE